MVGAMAAMLLVSVLSFFAAPSDSIYIVEPGPKFPPTRGEVWPKPQQEKKSDYFYLFRPDVIQIEIVNKKCNLLNETIERYAEIWQRQYMIVKRYNNISTLEPHDSEKYLGVLKRLTINMSAPCEYYPHFDMDESYNLTVGANSQMTSLSVWGMMRAFESWTHLLYFTDDSKEIRINKTEIHDFPQYKHRGLLLDTGRHYLSLNTIQKTLDAMSINKMNVLHWHIVDDQSFPYKSEILPSLSKKGAFHPSMVYTKKDIKMIINYARDRAIRVIPEIDVPGHTRSWGAAYPMLLTKCYEKNKVIAYGPLNPIRSTTYKILGELIQEVQDLFPDRYYHVGGDEVDLSCWQSNPELKEYMKQHNLTANGVHAMFMKEVIGRVKKTTVPIVWQEVYDEKVPISKDTLIQVWKYKWIDEMIKILNSGHKVVFSSSWYLDYLNFNWNSFYGDDPRLMVYQKKKNARLENIVGGEACMWGEMADDTNVISRTWPRTSAVAERLWSGLDYKHPPKDPVTTHVRQRIEEHTCRMLRRGIAAEPPNGPGFCVNI